MDLVKVKYGNKSDEALMKLVQKGDKKAFETIYDRYASRMTNYFYRMLWQDKEKALDFTHDILLKIIEKPHYFDTNRNFKTWIYSVANNMCKNEYKRHQVHNTRSSNMENVMHVHKQKPDEGSQHDSKAFYQALLRELNKIEENQRETFILRYFDELSIKEVSEIQGISEGTVKSRLFYSLKKISPALREYEFLKTTSLNFQNSRP